MNNQWIKCSDRLPNSELAWENIDTARGVLVFVKDSYHVQGGYVAYMYAYEVDDVLDVVSHWMELPDRPEMEE